MDNIESLPLFHSWPLFDADARLGFHHPSDLGGSVSAADPLARYGIGTWSCDLATSSLSWSPAVFELFGIPTDEPLTRGLAVSCYVQRSRRAMEMLRAHAIKHRRGFTLDAMIRRPDGEQRWMRLSAMPVLAGGQVVRLCGTKQDVTADYDGPGWRGF